MDEARRPCLGFLVSGWPTEFLCWLVGWFVCLFSFGGQHAGAALRNAAVGVGQHRQRGPRQVPPVPSRRWVPHGRHPLEHPLQHPLRHPLWRLRVFDRFRVPISFADHSDGRVTDGIPRQPRASLASLESPASQVENEDRFRVSVTKGTLPRRILR